MYNMSVSEVANSYVNCVLSDSGITRGYADTVGFRNVPGNEIWSIYNPNNYTKYIMKFMILSLFHKKYQQKFQKKNSKYNPQ